jgi:glycosyltransferase involved in cell wall biosynthesis
MHAQASQSTPSALQRTQLEDGAAPVSVVVPCYRCADTIGASVASIAAQTLLPAEVLLVDDCSGDGTLEALHGVASQHRAGWVKVLTSPRNGDHRRRAILAGRTPQEYIAFLDADDTGHPPRSSCRWRR